VQACYVSVMFVSCPAARFHATSRTMCIYVYLCVCLHVRDMYAIWMRQRGHFTLKAAGTSLSRQRALSRTICMRQRGHFHALYVCGSVGTFTHCMYAAYEYERGDTCMSAATPGHVGGDGSAGLHARSSLLGFAFESVVRVLWSCGPAGVVCAVMLSAMYAHDLARLRTTC